MKYSNRILRACSALMFTSLLLIDVACVNQSGDTPMDTTATQYNQSTGYFKTLLVIGDDRSGSTTDIRKLTREDYVYLINAIGQKGGGTVAVSLIGNPKAESREPYIMNLSTLHNITPFDPKDTRLTLTQKGQLKNANEKITKENETLIQQNSTTMEEFISNSVQPAILNYKALGADMTDLDDALARINTLINEPQYKEYDKIIIALISDGKNQPKSKIMDITSKITNQKAELYLVGWETSTDCFKDLNFHILSAKDGLFENINNLKIN